jgi:2,4-dienoyl-CoA reductase-like NADH-dependent reductase (Old Yellow Enzyme family)
MTDIFSPWQMAGLELSNRLVRSATWEGMAAADGTISDNLIDLSVALASGGVGLIITGYAYIDPAGLGLPRQTGIHDDALVESLSRLPEAVHAEGGRIIMQIVHAGGQTKSEWTGTGLVGPSKLVHPAFGEEVEALTRSQIGELVEAFAAAARRVKAAGFDGVQLHGAHGYLINQFLSPSTNLRDDEYGGSIENRARFCYQVYTAVRDAVGSDFPVCIKLNTNDAIAGGLELEDALVVAGQLSALGIDAIEVSGGVPAAGKLSSARLVKDLEDEAYFLDNARAVKEVVSCPVMVVGGFRSRSKVESALESIDAVAMSRPFIRQPDLAKLWREGSSDRAECVSCGKCFSVGLKYGLGCGAIRVDD